MWYVVHTMAGLEQKCMQQCQQYVDQADYSEMFIPLYMAKKHFRQEWHDVEKPLFPGCFFRVRFLVQFLNVIVQLRYVLLRQFFAPVKRGDEAF